jgi:hypothetical protein
MNTPIILEHKGRNIVYNEVDNTWTTEGEEGWRVFASLRTAKQSIDNRKPKAKPALLLDPGTNTLTPVKLAGTFNPHETAVAIDAAIHLVSTARLYADDDHNRYILANLNTMKIVVDRMKNDAAVVIAQLHPLA